MMGWAALATAFLMTFILFGVGVYLLRITFDRLMQGLHRRSWIAFISLVLLSCVTCLTLYQWKANDGPLSLLGQFRLTAAPLYQSGVRLGDTTVAVGGGGYVTGIYTHPQQRDLIYIKTDVGGFYRWNPQNQSWIPLTDHFSLDDSNYYSGESLAVDPNNSNVVYIAAGSYTEDWWEHKGAIFKSTDRGTTWTKLGLEVKMGGNEGLRWAGERLAVSPTNSNRLLFASRRDGLWQSSNAGVTWSKVNFPHALHEKYGITSIVFDPRQTGRVYAAAHEDGVYQSSDSGATWRKLANSPDRVRRLAIASNGILYAAHKEGVSKYESSNWHDVTPTDKPDTFNAIAIDPHNPQHLLVSLGETDSTRIYRSTDGGRSWVKQERSLRSTVPWWDGILLSQPWIAAIEFDPHVNGRVWLTDWYGIWRTDRIQTNPVVWTNYQDGHEELVIFTLVSPPKGALLLTGAADVDGFYHDKGLDTYPSHHFGEQGPSYQDTYSIAYSERDPLRMVRVGGNRWNSTYGGATSADGGKTWHAFEAFPQGVMPVRVAVSATDPDRFVVLLTEKSPIVTSDNGRSWQTVSGLPEGVGGTWYWSQPLAADLVDGDTFYYYESDDAKLYRSTDSGVSFKLVNESLPQSYWYSLKTLPGEAGDVWLSLDDDGLYRSQDGGDHFTPVAGVERAYLFAFGKAAPGRTTPTLYLYGEIAGKGEGIFRSLDLGRTWTAIGNPQRPVGKEPKYMEASKQIYGLVFIGTGGRGIYYGS